jgi:hypothetical protein
MSCHGFFHVEHKEFGSLTRIYTIAINRPLMGVGITGREDWT